MVPCNTDICRYTKEGKDEVKPAFDPNRAKQIAKFAMVAQEETDWLSSRQKSHPVKIKRQDLIDDILR